MKAMAHYKVTILFCCLALAQSSIIETSHDPAPSASYSSTSSPIAKKAITTPFIQKTILTPTTYTNIAPIHYGTVISTQQYKFKPSDGSDHAEYSKSVDNEYFSSKCRSQSNGEIFNHDDGIFYSTAIDPDVATYPQYNVKPAHHIVSIPIKPISVPITYPTPNSKTLVTPVSSFNSYRFEDSEIFNPVHEYSIFTKSFATPSESYGTPIETIHTSNTPVKLTQNNQHNAYDSYMPSYDKSNAGSVAYPSQNTKYNVPYLYGTPGAEKSLKHDFPAASKPSLFYSKTPVVSHLSFSGLGTNYGW